MGNRFQVTGSVGVTLLLLMALGCGDDASGQGSSPDVDTDAGQSDVTADSGDALGDAGSDGGGGGDDVGADAAADTQQDDAGHQDTAGDDQGGHESDLGESDTGDDAFAVGGCDASPLESGIIEEIIAALIFDLEWTATNSEGSHRGYAFKLVGIPSVNAGTATLIESCTQPSAFDPWCEPDPDSGLNRCLRFGCDDANLGWAEVYLTDGSTESADERHPVSYDSPLRSGTVTYDPNPYRRWVVDETGDATVVSLEAEHQVTVAPDGAEPIDATHTIDLVTTVVDGHPTEVTGLITFASISDLGIVSVELTYVAEGDLTGVIQLGDGEIATLVAGADTHTNPFGMLYTWNAASCGL